ncbi:hypothetical protein [Sphaerisporangium aureirubrum]|uniref:EfeO-type cupredoxin-like domain-containing protein n=1 Tax=Sphaerisporangium aureirubrum TaxID=1544736 RepID=A0ABW1NLU8_9ACTN
MGGCGFLFILLFAIVPIIGSCIAQMASEKARMEPAPPAPEMTLAATFRPGDTIRIYVAPLDPVVVWRRGTGGIPDCDMPGGRVSLNIYNEAGHEVIDGVKWETVLTAEADTAGFYELTCSNDQSDLVLGVN